MIDVLELVNGQGAICSIDAIVQTIRDHPPSTSEAIFATEQHGENPFRRSGWLVDGAYHGPWVFEYDDHWAIAAMDAGRQVGTTAYLYPSGLLQAIGTEIDGVREGTWREFSDAVLTSEMEYKDGAIDGAVSKYRADGTLHLEGTMKGGVWVGDVREYGADGTLIGMGPIVGRLAERTGHWRRYEHGSLIAEGELVDSIPVGTWRLLRDGTTVGTHDYDMPG